MTPLLLPLLSRVLPERARKQAFRPQYTVDQPSHPAASPASYPQVSLDWGLFGLNVFLIFSLDLSSTGVL